MLSVRAKIVDGPLPLLASLFLCVGAAARANASRLAGQWPYRLDNERLSPSESDEIRWLVSGEAEIHLVEGEVV